jgi:galacturan 1,4-alpha-galacturonidase
MFCHLSIFIALWFLNFSVRGATFSKEGSTCTVQPSVGVIDDAIAIREAFEACKTDSKIVFISETYNISSVLVTTGLRNVRIEMPAYLIVRLWFHLVTVHNCWTVTHRIRQWSENITYWVNNSVPLGYQNQTCAWVFGGTNITLVVFQKVYDP